MSHHFRPILLAFAGVTFLAGSTISSLADDYLSRAATHYRDKDFGSAYTSAIKSTDQTHRAFIAGMAALQSDKFEEAAALLAEAEQKLPLIADYAIFFQAEALQKLKRYPAAAAKAAAIKTSFPSSRLLRRSEKLSADIMYDGSDYRGALKAYQAYIEKYPSGSDSVDANFQSARCLEELLNAEGALQIYRNIWLNNPAAAHAAKSQERLKKLEQSGLKLSPYTAEELLKRAFTLYAQNSFTASLKTLEMIPVASQTQALASRVDLRTGMAMYRLRQYKQAGQQFIKASSSTLPGVRSEARLWLAKSLDRQDQKERAFALYLELVEEGKKQEFAGEALIEAAGLQRTLGRYSDAARLFDKVSRLSTDARVITKSTWDAAWCRYLNGEYPAAAEAFKGLLADDAYREKSLYWLGSCLEKSGAAASTTYYRSLLDEFPAGFYATWYREQRGIKDSREPLGSRDAVTELPLAAGYEKPRLLASLGLFEEARTEMSSIRKKNGDKKGNFPVLARNYLEMRDFGAAIALFAQYRPTTWEKSNLPLWTAGYPRAYADLIRQNAAVNGLSEGLVYALIRAESSFTPAIKSRAGAIGLMQMMPATARQVVHEKGSFDPQKLTVPEYNIRLGTKHLHDLMKEYNGDVIYMAAAYNAGSGALERWKKSFKGLKKDEFIESIPYQETRDYVKKVYASAATYRQLYGLK
jgi:soluble lytic murein transglycosylase